MRTTAALCLSLAATSAQAWDFSRDPLCRLTHIEGEAGVQITFDPRSAKPYTIEVARPTRPWPESPVFGIEFTGARSSQIFTDQHELSEDRTRVTVADHGFGNLLDGLALNNVATALMADASVEFSLAGASAAVAAFRACTVRPVA